MKRSKKLLKIGEEEIIDLSLLMIFSTIFFIITRANLYPLEVIYSKFVSFLINAKNYSNVLIYGKIAFQINKYCLGTYSYLFFIFLFLMGRKINIRIFYGLIFLFFLNLFRIILAIVFYNHFYVLHDILGNVLMVSSSILLWVYLDKDIKKKLLSKIWKS